MKEQNNRSSERDLMIIERLEFTKRVTPLLQKKGIVVKKTGTIHAIKAKGGEQIATVVDKHLETTNVANVGDFIITNQTSEKEQYIISSENFAKRYSLIQNLEHGNATYCTKLTLTAIQLTADVLEKLELPRQFYFVAPWGAKQFAEENDFIVSNHDFTDIYRVCLSKFLETYETIDQK